jgi:hypothetical protein
MAEVKSNRTKKKQLGQFMTPIEKCENITSKYEFKITDKILEPSFGCGNFILTLIDKFIPLYDGTIDNKLTLILNNNIYGVEFDTEQYDLCLKNISEKYGFLPDSHNLILGDYFLYKSDILFDYIIGNPPFGGTIDPKYQDEMDRKYGFRDNQKIKKETYSFFIVKSIESLKENGKLIFISSDTFLTINTMTGLRRFLYNSGSNYIEKLNNFSEETDYPMIVLTHNKSNKVDYIILDDNIIPYENMLLTNNFSWYIQDSYAKYFKGSKLSKYVIGTSGMTIGRNDLFLRTIKNDSTIIEDYDFNFFDDPITLKKEYAKARNGKISSLKVEQIKQLEKNGATKRNISITKKDQPSTIKIPNSDYCYYNKSSNEILYSEPKTVVYWKDNGDAVITFKKNGNWYLHGVGGKPYFKREGFTWQLISSSIKARYLPAGYILDSGSPIGVLREGIEKTELLFIIGWLLTDKCNEILKKVINHTKNIQSKDIERLPYPFWVNEENKSKAIQFIESSINYKKNKGSVPNDFKSKLNNLYNF